MPGRCSQTRRLQGRRPQRSRAGPRPRAPAHRCGCRSPTGWGWPWCRLPRPAAAPRPLPAALAGRWPRLTAAFYRLPPTPCPSPPPAGREGQQGPDRRGRGEPGCLAPPARRRPAAPAVRRHRPAAPGPLRAAGESPQSCRRGRGPRGSRCVGGAEGDPAVGQRRGPGVAPRPSWRPGAAGRGARGKGGRGEPRAALGRPGGGKGAAASCPDAQLMGI